MDLFAKIKEQSKLIMELEKKKLVDEIKKQDEISIDLAIRFLDHSLQALYELHKEPTKVHGDIKPENFIIVNDKIKLADFGACVKEGELIISGTKGTVGTQAPEILLNSEIKSDRSMDIYSIGICFYIILCKNNFRGNEANSYTEVNESFNKDRAVKNIIKRYIDNCQGLINIFNGLTDFNKDKRIPYLTEKFITDIGPLKKREQKFYS